MSFLKASIPAASIFAHCAAVKRIERCSSLASGGAGGRPRGRFGSSMAASVNHLLNHEKTLALAYLLNHNNYNATHLESSMDKQDTVAAEWIGQDGNKWRELRVWARGRFVYFLQREISPGLWA